MYGRHFDDKDDVVSLISRQSIDTLSQLPISYLLRKVGQLTICPETNFRDQVDISDWALIKKMKTEQGIP